MIKFLVAAALVATCTSPLRAGPREGGEDLRQALGAYFDSIEGFSGVVAIATGGHMVFQGAYGEADSQTGRPVTPDTAFLIGSISKQFTAAAVLVLAQDGRLAVSDRLAEHLDFVPEDKQAITLHHLLTHTSGMPDAYWDQHRDLDRQEFLEDRLETLDLLSQPGESFYYSNLNYDLLGLVIERVSGEPYEQFLDRRVFKPAGLAHTGRAIPEFDDVAMYRDPVTSVWTEQGIDVASPIDRPEYFQPIGSGGLLSTTADLLRWHAQLKTDAVLSDESRVAFQTPGLEDYAYGWRVMTLPNGDRAVHHGGFDDSIGVSTVFARVIGADVVVIILSNSIEGGFNASQSALECYGIMMEAMGGG